MGQTTSSLQLEKRGELVRITFDRLLLGARAGASGLVLQLHMLEVFIGRAVLENIKDWLLLDGLELGFEVLGTLGVRGRVAAAAGIVLIVDDIYDLSAWESPISFSTAILFGLLGIGVDEASFGKVLGRQVLVFMLLSVDGGVVTVAELVGASHVDGKRSG